MKKNVLAGMMVGFSLLGMGGGAQAAMDYDFSGTFAKDNDVLQVDFTVGATSTVTFFTSSWDDGGFDPYMSLWDSNGDIILLLYYGEYKSYVDESGAFDGASEFSNGVSYNYGLSDVYHVRTLEAGSYTATIMQFFNEPNGTSLSDGFQMDGDPHYTYDMGFGTQPDFNGSYSTWDPIYNPGGAQDPRNGNYEFHIVGVNPVPVPASLLLFGSALAGLIGVKRRK